MNLWTEGGNSCNVKRPSISFKSQTVWRGVNVLKPLRIFVPLPRGLSGSAAVILEDNENVSLGNKSGRYH